jgi:hypothetical protein
MGVGVDHDAVAPGRIDPFVVQVVVGDREGTKNSKSWAARVNGGSPGVLPEHHPKASA